MAFGWFVLVGCLGPADGKKKKRDDGSTTDSTGVTFDTGVTITKGAPIAALGSDDVPAQVPAGTRVIDVSGSATVTDNALTGSVEYGLTQGGTVLCDTEVSFTGSPSYSSNCPNCDFVFLLETTIEREDGTDACEYLPVLSLTELDGIQNFCLGWREEYNLYSSHGNYYFEDLLYVGYYQNSSGYWSTISCGGDCSAPYSEADFGGGELEWTFNRSLDGETTPTYLDYCDGNYVVSDASQLVGTNLGTSESTCDGSTLDVWRTRLIKGEQLEVAVDTVAANSAFDSVLWVTDPSGCLLMFADDNFDCTYPPTEYSCPAGVLTAAETGIYEIVVGSRGSCTGSQAEYALFVD